MILHIGVKTTHPELVAYRVLEPRESDTAALAELNAELRSRGAKPKEPTMIVFYDPKDDPDCKREVMIPVEKEVEGMPTKTLPQVRAGFIVYADTTRPIEHYYGVLERHLEERGLEPGGEICSIEAIFPPNEYSFAVGDFVDEDAPEHWKTEIIIPVEG